MTDPADRPQPDGYALVVPFTVCASQGGPYDDEAFVAGFQAGAIDCSLNLAAQSGAECCRFTVRTALVPQLELLAMHRGWPVMYASKSEADGWSYVEFRLSEPVEFRLSEPEVGEWDWKGQ